MSFFILKVALLRRCSSLRSCQCVVRVATRRPSLVSEAAFNAFGSIVEVTLSATTNGLTLFPSLSTLNCQVRARTLPIARCQRVHASSSVYFLRCRLPLLETMLITVYCGMHTHIARAHVHESIVHSFVAVAVAREFTHLHQSIYCGVDSFVNHVHHSLLWYAHCQLHVRMLMRALCTHL